MLKGPGLRQRLKGSWGTGGPWQWDSDSGPPKHKSTKTTARQKGAHLPGAHGALTRKISPPTCFGVWVRGAGAVTHRHTVIGIDTGRKRRVVAPFSLLSASQSSSAPQQSTRGSRGLVEGLAKPTWSTPNRRGLELV